MRPRPTIIEALADPELLGCLGMDAPSWGAWHVILKGSYGLALTTLEVRVFREMTGLDAYNPPPGGWRRIVIIAGRQSGKSQTLGAVVDYESLFPTAEGDNLRAVLVAQDTEALKSTLFAYAKSPFEGPLEASVLGSTTTTLRLDTGVTMRAYPCSSKAVRGARAQVVVLDEWAFYRSSTGESLEKRVAEAARYSLLTTGGRTWIGSSPYDEGSELHHLYEQFWGKANDGTIVFQADTATLNPTIPQATLDAMRAEDPDAAEAELDAKFRKGVTALFDMMNVVACVDRGRTERPFEMGTKYKGFADYASGTRAGLDRYTATVGHPDKTARKVVIDAQRTWYPPFDPKTATRAAAEFFKSYGVERVHGDKAALGFVAGEFRDHGIIYDVTEGSTETASALILRLLPMVNAKSVVLLDDDKALSEFRTVRRVLSRQGVEKTDHPRGTHDDMLVGIAGVAFQCYETIALPSAASVISVTMNTRGERWVTGATSKWTPEAQYASDGRGPLLMPTTAELAQTERRHCNECDIRFDAPTFETLIRICPAVKRAELDWFGEPQEQFKPQDDLERARGFDYDAWNLDRWRRRR